MCGCGMLRARCMKIEGFKLKGMSQTHPPKPPHRSFLSEMCTTHCKAIGPQKAKTWDHTRQSIKFGVNQANTVMHIHRMGKTDERNQPVVPCFLHLPYHLASNSLARSLSVFLSLFLSFFLFLLSLSLSLCRFCGNFPSNNVICSKGYLAITLAIT